MSRTWKILAVLMLALYGLASEHCKLEGMPGFGFLQTCCATENKSSLPRDCSQDECGSVESGDYRSEEGTVLTPEPILLVAAVLPLVDDVGAGSTFAGECFSPAPPELARCWQFSSRAALRPRAPTSLA